MCCQTVAPVRDILIKCLGTAAKLRDVRVEMRTTVAELWAKQRHLGYSYKYAVHSIQTRGRVTTTREKAVKMRDIAVKFLGTLHKLRDTT